MVLAPMPWVKTFQFKGSVVSADELGGYPHICQDGVVDGPFTSFRGYGQEVLHTRKAVCGKHFTMSDDDVECLESYRVLHYDTHEVMVRRDEYSISIRIGLESKITIGFQTAYM